MNTLQIAYKILYSLEHKEKADYMGTVIGPKKLGVENYKWAEVLCSLSDEGYIAGAKFGKDILGNAIVDIKNIRITLKGAEYLHENSAMKRIGEIASNVISVIK